MAGDLVPQETQEIQDFGSLCITAMWLFNFFLVKRTLKQFKASALWADAFFKLIGPYVNLCVCSLLSYRLNVFLPPLPEVGCPQFLEIWDPWGKVIERIGLTFENFY